MFVKKLSCYISILLMVIILVIFGFIFKNKKFLALANKNTCMKEKNTIESENTVDIEQEKNIPVEDIRNEVSQNQPLIETVEKTTTTETTSSPQNTIIQDYTPIQNTDETQNNTNENAVTQQKNECDTQKKEEKQENKKQDIPKNIKTYQRNTTMEHTMKEYIKNNPSEFMQKYGFNISSDSSIVEHTNEFTYTEKRVKSKIKYKFGTIKIYAHDVLLDGVYQFTECFIL